MGAKERRSRLIRLEAKRLTENPPAGPVIAAGSTGTIPATRELLKAISTLENGAVILPALDEGMDAKSWEAVSPQHPQFAIKQLVEAIGVERENIITLGTDSGDRAWLASELMRPSEVSDDWQQALAGQGGRIKRALENVSLVEARDKNDEASIIALMMRQALENPMGDMALVTPDRDLARRVKANLSRWNIGVDDSAGEPLSRLALPPCCFFSWMRSKQIFLLLRCKACSAIISPDLALNGPTSAPWHENRGRPVPLVAHGSGLGRFAAFVRPGP